MAAIYRRHFNSNFNFNGLKSKYSDSNLDVCYQYVELTNINQHWFGYLLCTEQA